MTMTNILKVEKFRVHVEKQSFGSCTKGSPPRCGSLVIAWNVTVIIML